MPADTSAFTPPPAQKVKIGQAEYDIFECRPGDIAVWGCFAETLKGGGLMDALKTTLAGDELNIDFKQALPLLKSQPAKLCELLAALLDPRPQDPGAKTWREQRARDFMAAPISEVTRAYAAWIEVNSAFFADTMAPLVAAAAMVMDRVNTILAQRIELAKRLSIGSA
jgi:hypothetical protein